MKKSLVIFFLISSFVNSEAQLTPLYAQFGFNPIALNPAVAGYHENFTASLTNRSSLKGGAGAPSTQFFSAHTPLGQKGWVGGLEVINDKAGLWRSMNFSGIAGYGIRMKESSLTAAIKLGYSSASTLWSQSVTSITSDPLITADENQSGMLMTAGIFYRDSRTNLGLAQSTTRQFDVSTQGVLVHGSYNFGSLTKFYWRPAFALRYNKSMDMLADINLTVNHDRMGSLGFSFRSNHSYAAFLRIVISGQLWTTVSMDFFSNKVPSGIRNSLEVSLNYDLFRKSSSPNPLIF